MSAIPRSRISRRVQKEARVLVREARRALARHSDRIPTSVQSNLRLSSEALEKARTDGDDDAMRGELVRLDNLVDEHLAFTRKSTLREYAESIGVAVAIALLLRAFVVEAFKIPSGSMIPTMEIGDHIFVNKFLYGVRIPFTDSKIFQWRSPHHGEVIVFRNPCDPDKDFIKRVVAVAGETVEVRCDVLYINGKAVPTDMAGERVIYWDHLEPDDHAVDSDCEIQRAGDRWIKCAASDYVEHHGDGSYHTYYGPERVTRERRRAERPLVGYWAYNPGRSGVSEQYLGWSRHDFPRLPLPSAADALLPDGTPADPSGAERLAAALRLIDGESPETVAEELSARYSGEPWCRTPGCITPEAVQSWLPRPASCRDPDAEAEPAAHYAFRAHLRAPARPEDAACAPKLAYVVPDGHVFAMGDNRWKSSDSRFWGPVPLDNIKGKALFIWLSSKPSEAGGYHWSRIGKIVR